MKRITNAKVVTEEAIIPDACVEVADGRIVSVASGRAQSRSGDVDLGGAWLVPGFLDVHVHPEPPESLADLRAFVEDFSRKLLALGTTGILWTLGSMAPERTLATAAGLREILADPPDPCAIMGIHFEGPYISPASLGAFDPDTICTPDELAPEKLFEAAGPALAYLSLSPDAPGAVDVIRACVERGVRVGIGHSLATPEVVQQAVEAGAGSVIHTFNNTPRYPMKEPGVRGVTLDEFAMSSGRLMNEVVCDGMHVDPILVRALARAKEAHELMIITDSVAGGIVLGEGEQIRSGKRPVFIRGGVGRNDQGQMSGSSLTMERAFRNFVAFTWAGLPRAVSATSLNAARFLGLHHERGRIASGYRADFAVLDEDLLPRMDLLGKA